MKNSEYKKQHLILLSVVLTTMFLFACETDKKKEKVVETCKLTDKIILGFQYGMSKEEYVSHLETLKQNKNLDGMGKLVIRLKSDSVKFKVTPFIDSMEGLYQLKLETEEDYIDYVYEKKKGIVRPEGYTQEPANVRDAFPYELFEYFVKSYGEKDVNKCLARPKITLESNDDGHLNFSFQRVFMATWSCNSYQTFFTYNIDVRGYKYSSKYVDNFKNWDLVIEKEKELKNEILDDYKSFEKMYPTETLIGGNLLTIIFKNKPIVDRHDIMNKQRQESINKILLKKEQDRLKAIEEQF